MFWVFWPELYVTLALWPRTEPALSVLEGEVLTTVLKGSTPCPPHSSLKGKKKGSDKQPRLYLKSMDLALPVSYSFS